MKRSFEKDIKNLIIILDKMNFDAFLNLIGENFYIGEVILRDNHFTEFLSFGD